MYAKREAPLSLDSNPGAPQLSRAIAKRSTKTLRFLGDSLRIVAALTLAAAVMAGAEWVTHQARPIVIVVGAYVFLVALLLLIAWKEL